VTINIHTGKLGPDGSLRLLQRCFETGVGVSLDLVPKIRVRAVQPLEVGQNGEKYVRVCVGDRVQIGDGDGEKSVWFNRPVQLPDGSVLVFGGRDVVAQVAEGGRILVVNQAGNGGKIFNNHGVAGGNVLINERRGNYLLTETDHGLLAKIPANSWKTVREVVLSFVCNSRQVHSAINSLAQFGCNDSRICLKIETQSAFENLEELACKINRVVIGCGDLGVTCEVLGWNLEDTVRLIVSRLHNCGYIGKLWLAYDFGDSIQGDVAKMKFLKELEDELGRQIGIWLTGSTMNANYANIMPIIDRFVDRSS
jgi:hypothetical protein